MDDMGVASIPGADSFKDLGFEGVKLAGAARANVEQVLSTIGNGGEKVSNLMFGLRSYAFRIFASLLIPS